METLLGQLAYLGVQLAILNGLLSSPAIPQALAKEPVFVKPEIALISPLNAQEGNQTTSTPKTPQIEDKAQKTGVSLQSLPSIFKEIARCESGGSQNDKNGNIVRSHTNDVGILQISEKYHKITAEKMGFNLYEESGNLAYGLYLYQNQGLKPWSASKHCWNK